MDRYKALKYLSYLFSNKLSQNFLDINIVISQYLRGVGAGAGVLNSGEEKVVDKLVESLSDENICVFDVGANKGDFISLIVDKAERNYTVHAFEPVSSTFNTLAERYGNDEEIKVNNCALSRNDGEKKIYYDEEGSGLASMTKRDVKHIDKSMDKQEKVRVYKLNSYCSKNNINKIDILKVDVEGHELDVFEGAKKIMNRGLVKYIIFEFGGCNVDTRTYMKDYFSFFESVGFEKISRITPSGYLCELDGYSEKVEQFMTTNYLVEM